ncbi:MAG TPA: RsmE family RNA methyltransferase, partial [Syntrophales bacterium]
MSKPPRFFISPEQVIDQHITITGEDVRHIATVLRMKTGDELLLCDGKGAEYSVEIAQVNKSEIKTDVKVRSKREIRHPLITLGQGLPKSDKMDWIVQKATELGVATIVPLVTERTIMKIRDEEKRISRWQKICREAAMQSNRPDIPKVDAIRTFVDFLQTPNDSTERLDRARRSLVEVSEPGMLLLLPWEEATVSIKNVLQQTPGITRIIVLIGPEGGFSAQEAEKAKEK